jgi:hypothetical protein
VGSGAVSIRFERSFLSFLKSDGIRVSAAAPARVNKGTVLLPVSAGLMDPTLGKSSIEAEGSFAFQSARKRVPFRAVKTKTKHSPLIAKVGGSQLKIATAGRLAAGRTGFDAKFSARSLRLTAKVATRLNKKLRPLHPFVAGQLVGSMVTNANPQTVTVLPEGKVSMELQPDFIAKLNSLLISVNPIFPAEHSGSLFTVPVIPGGTLAPAANGGTLKTGGDLEFLQLHSNTQIFMHELWFDFALRMQTGEIDIEPSPPYRGKLGRVSIFDLSGGSVSTDAGARTIGVSDAQLLMQPAIASAFNEAFGEGGTPFTPGETIAKLSFVAQTQ